MHNQISKSLLIVSMVFLIPVMAQAVSPYHSLSHAELVEIVKVQHQKIKSLEEERNWLKFNYGLRGSIFGAIGALTLYKLGEICFSGPK